MGRVHEVLERERPNKRKLGSEFETSQLEEPSVLTNRVRALRRDTIFKFDQRDGFVLYYSLKEVIEAIVRGI
jgi:hypothetical protein